MAETFGGGASPAAGGGGGGGAVSGSHLSHLSGEDSASAAMSMSAFGGGGHSLFGSWGQEEAGPEGLPGGEYPEEGADGGQVSSTTPFYPNAQFQFMESEEGGDPEMSAPDPGLPPPDPAMDPLKRAYSGRKTEYIEDRKSRYKSYHRRRPIPFKKIHDLDEYCDTHTLLVQMCEDFDECLFAGPQEMIEQFMAPDGLRISNLDQLIIKMKKVHRPRHLTLTERERAKSYRSRRESLMAKIHETDDVCGCASFLLTLRLDNGAAFYCGDPVMVTRFFGEGVSRAQLDWRINVRPFEQDEGEHATCTVRHCLVSRHSLPRWRRAAIEHFGWPSDLPLTLHTARSFAQRGQWAAELDLDPGSLPARMGVCSLHFASGKPTEEDPLPSVLLRDTVPQEEARLGRVMFGGKRLKTTTDHRPSVTLEPETKKEEVDDQEQGSATENKAVRKFVRLQAPPKSKLVKKRRKGRKTKKLSVKVGGRKATPAVRCAKGLVRRAVKNGLGSQVRCRRSGTVHKGQRNFYNNFLEKHCPRAVAVVSGPVESEPKKNTPVQESALSAAESSDDDEDDEKLIIDLEAGAMAGKKKKKKASSAAAPSVNSVPIPENVTVSDKERAAALKALYPASKSKTMNQRKKYVCAVCKSVCDLFGLFLHMKQVHKGILCQYCLKLFKRVSDLEGHLKTAHDVGGRYFHSVQQFKEHAGEQYTFICAECNTVVESDSLDRHDCKRPLLPSKKGFPAGRSLTFDCPFCGRSFLQRQQLEMHLCNGWCKKMSFQHSRRPATAEEVAKLYKVLTGMDLTAAAAGSEFMVSDSSEAPSATPSTVVAKEDVSSSSAPPSVFRLSDRSCIMKYGSIQDGEGDQEPPSSTSSGHPRHRPDPPVALSLPRDGSVFYPGLRVVNNYVKKEMRESGHAVDLVALLRGAGVQSLRGKEPKTDDDKEKPSRSLREVLGELEVTQAGRNFILRNPRREREEQEAKRKVAAAAEEDRRNRMLEIERRQKGSKVPPLTIRAPQPIAGGPRRSSSSLVLKVPTPAALTSTTTAASSSPSVSGIPMTTDLASVVAPPKRKKESKKQRRTRIAGEIYDNMVRIKDALDLFRSSCLFCQQTRYVSVDTVFLLTHLGAVHDRDVAVKEALGGEDTQHCIDRIRRHLKDVRVRDSIFTYDVVDEFALSGYGKYRCCYCSSERVFSEYSELFKHVEKEHETTVLTCHLCQNIFLNYGSYASHVCFGPPSTPQAARAKFRCKICKKQDMGNFFDFQFHVRKTHNACEMCFKNEPDQESLYKHCQSHALELMCTKCLLTYDSRLQFRKHLHFKHGEESKACRHCHHRTWPHVYHFCIKQTDMTCEVCDKHFGGLKPYRVHMRTHSGDNPYLCNAKGCQQAYISRPLLWKHQVRRHPELANNAAKSIEEKRNKRLVVKLGAARHGMESIWAARSVIQDLIEAVIPEPEPETEPEPEQEPEEDEAMEEEEESAKDDQKSKGSGGEGEEEDLQEEETYDPIDAAVRSIMGPEGSFDVRKSPTKSPARGPGAPGGININVGGGVGGGFRIPPPVAASPRPQSLLSPPSAPAALVPPHRPAPRPPVPMAPSAANYASAISGGVGVLDNGGGGPPSVDDGEPPQMVVRKQSSATPVIQHRQIIRPPPPQRPGLPPPQRGANVRFPVAPQQSGLKTLNASSMPGFGPGGGEGGDGDDGSAEEDADDESVEDEASPAPTRRIVSSIWNQDLLDIIPEPAPGEGKVDPVRETEKKKDRKSESRKTIKTLTPSLGWDVALSESSSDSEGEGDGGGSRAPKKAKIVERLTDRKLSLKDHDYCFAAFQAAQPTEDLSEMGKILSDVALGAAEPAYKSPEAELPPAAGKKKHKKSKKKKKKKKKKRKRREDGDGGGSSSSDSDAEVDVTGGGPAAPRTQPTPIRPLGPKPKYHAPGASKGVMAQTARPRFSSSSEDEDGEKRGRRREEEEEEEQEPEESTGEIASSDLDTDFEAEGLLVNLKQIQTQARRIKPSAKAVEAEESRKMKKDDNEEDSEGEGDAGGNAFDSDDSADISGDRSDSDQDVTVSKYHQKRLKGSSGTRLSRPPPLPPKPQVQQPLKLKIKLPPRPGSTPTTPSTPLTASGRPRMINTFLTNSAGGSKTAAKSAAAAKSRVALSSSAKGPMSSPFSPAAISSPSRKRPSTSDREDGGGGTNSSSSPQSSQPLSKKMRESLALNRPDSESESSSEDEASPSSGGHHNYGHQTVPVQGRHTQLQIQQSPASLNDSVDTKLYCVCQCPHDDVSEMIGCDAPDCRLEWFHFECVGIMVPPDGKWYCPECSKRYKVHQ